VNEIQLIKIEHEHRLNCPNCGHTRLVAKTKSSEVPGGGCWLSDGDTIFGLYDDLVKAGFEKSVTSWDDASYIYFLLVGTCPACHKEYVVLQVSMIDAEVDNEFVESYFRENAPVPPPTNYVANLAERNLEWLIERHDTAKGVALTHIIGPFALKNGKTMKGQYGVSACSSGDFDTWQAGRELVFGLWPQLKTLARAVNQKAT